MAYLTNEEAKDAGLYGLKKSREYEELLNAYLRKELLESRYEDVNRKYADEMIVAIEQVLCLIRSRIGRLKALTLLISSEIAYLREQPAPNKPAVDSAFMLCRGISHSVDSLMAEYNFQQSIWHRLHDRSLREKSGVAAAIRYDIRKAKERYTGKTSPVTIMLKNYVEQTPYAGYGVRLALQKKTIWEDAKTRCRYCLFPEDVVLSPAGFNDSNKMTFDEMKSQFRDIIEYCYSHEKTSFLERRNEWLIMSEAARVAQKKESEKKRLERQKETAKKRLDQFLHWHRKWYLLESSRIAAPAYYVGILDKIKDTEESYLIGVVWKEGTMYKTGYLTEDGDANRTLAGARVVYTIDEANTVIDSLPDMYLDASAIRLADMTVSTRIMRSRRMSIS